MIEFPRRGRSSIAVEPALDPQSIPAWKLELSERVKAVRAKRAGSVGAQEETSDPPVGRSVGVGAAAVRQAELAATPVEETSASESAAVVPAPQPPARTTDTIVEAALNRVRRAAEVPVHVAPPSMESRPTQVSSVVLSDRHATARALEVRAEPARVTPPLPDFSESELVRPETEPVFVAEEIEPCDYLEAEIRKVDRKLATEFAKNESPSLAVHFIIGVVDLLVIGLSSAPFMVLIQNTSGFAAFQSKFAAGLIAALLSFFYLAVTQTLCGKTFGMMLTNTRVVHAGTFQTVSPARALVRSIGYFFALAPAALGFLWAVVNKKHRGWHDLISGTLVARDF